MMSQALQGARNAGRDRRLGRGVLMALLMALAPFGAGPARAQVSPDFDHIETRFPLTGAHERVACESCHALGIFWGVPTRCAFCHDGTGARAETAKPRKHVRSSNRCDDCHDTVLWSRFVFDHADVGGRCLSCHGRGQGEEKPRRHVRTRADCDECHSTLAWTPAHFGHDDLSRSCASCHDGSTATGKRSRHFVTTADCDRCHVTRDWDRTHFRHQSADYPRGHRGGRDCRGCHATNRETPSWSRPGLQPDCGACHASDYERDEHKKEERTETRYSVSELRDCTGACHLYVDASLTTIKKRRSGEHRVRDGEFDD
jgi:hypothetical protein